jgi:hypothetical protein
LAGLTEANVSRRAKRRYRASASMWRSHTAANIGLAPLEASAAPVRLRERGNSWSSGALSPMPECILGVGGGEGEDDEVLEELILRLKAEESRCR